MRVTPGCPTRRAEPSSALPQPHTHGQTQREFPPGADTLRPSTAFHPSPPESAVYTPCSHHSITHAHSARANIRARFIIRSFCRRRRGLRAYFLKRDNSTSALTLLCGARERLHQTRAHRAPCRPSIRVYTHTHTHTFLLEPVMLVGVGWIQCSTAGT